MRTTFTALAYAMILSALAPAAMAATAQQNKMKTCNAEAGTKALKGDERKAFMSTCLSAKAPAAAPTQQTKMKTCNVDASAKALKGDERKAFMSTCLKG
jgi:hypothetical protein